MADTLGSLIGAAVAFDVCFVAVPPDFFSEPAGSGRSCSMPLLVFGAQRLRWRRHRMKTPTARPSTPTITPTAMPAVPPFDRPPPEVLLDVGEVPVMMGALVAAAVGPAAFEDISASLDVGLGEELVVVVSPKSMLVGVGLRRVDASMKREEPSSKPEGASTICRLATNESATQKSERINFPKSSRLTYEGRIYPGNLRCPTPLCPWDRRLACSWQ